jgi:ribonucleotide reductase alpha subunit
MTDAAVRDPTSPAGQRRDELGLSPAALAVLAARYLRRDAEGRVVESTGHTIDRVATHVAAAEDAYRRDVRQLGRGVLRDDARPPVPAELADAHERRELARRARGVLRVAGR